MKMKYENWYLNFLISNRLISMRDMYTEVRNNEGDLNVIGWMRIPLRYSIQFIVYITKFGTSMVKTIYAETHRQMLLCAPGIRDPYSTGKKKFRIRKQTSNMIVSLNLSIFLSKNNFKSLGFGVSSDFFTSCKGHSPGRPLWSHRISANSTGA